MEMLKPRDSSILVNNNYTILVNNNYTYIYFIKILSYYHSLTVSSYGEGLLILSLFSFCKLAVPCQYMNKNIMYVRQNLNLCSKRGERHNYVTKNRNQLVQPRFRLAKVETFFMRYFLSWKCYNKIPPHMKEELNETRLIFF